MLLAIDIGNTNIVLGVFEGDELVRSWRVSTRKDQTADEYGVFLRNLFQLDEIDTRKIADIAICSVVPPLNDTFVKMARLYFGRKPAFVDPISQDLMPIRYQPASDVGADRIVNAVAVRSRLGTPAVVVDFGTATTFDAVSREGEYLGGVIAPGVGISADALFARASRLPRVEIRRPAQVIGQSTVNSIQSGIYYGYLGLVDGILKRMSAELGGARVVATGGLAPLLKDESSGIEAVEPDLTLYGLKLFQQSGNLLG
ncbi:MAG TPA: type III pantothenate kinase [Acidobacteriota bacterium]|nr:type III pantothenate kinase [Acidobacteriota bacterium]